MMGQVIGDLILGLDVFLFYGNLLSEIINAR